MWVDRYAPKSESELVGNRNVIANFKHWLKDWEDVIMRGHKKKVEYKGKKAPPNLNARACLISGSPGIGKTSAVRIVSKELGFHCFELNASDIRSKLKIEAMLTDLSKSNSITAMIKNAKDGDKPWSLEGKTLILMDEVDGVGAGDRGGLPALIKIIKLSKMPIVCIANDIGNRKI